MVRFASFQLVWLLAFFIPLILSIFDNRMFFLPLTFFVSEVWRVWTHFIGGEWVPTPQRIVDKMLELARVKKSDIVYDLGAGDGKIVISAAKLGAKSTGIEIDPIRVLMGKAKLRLNRLNNAEIKLGNLYKVDLKNVTVVTLFLLPKTMQKIERKLRKELKKGSRIVSHKFAFKNWKPVKVDQENKIYLYNV
jgi:predicted RNA methylase